MIGSRLVSLGLTAVFLASPGVASAKCTKDGALVCGRGASSIASEAPLEVSHGGDFTPLAGGTALQGGDRVLVGPAEAKLALGPSCRAAVGPGSLVSIEKRGKETCASVTQQAAQGEVPPPAAGVDPVLVGAGVLAGAGAIAAGVVLSNSGNGGGNGTVSSR